LTFGFVFVVRRSLYVVTRWLRFGWRLRSFWFLPRFVAVAAWTFAGSTGCYVVTGRFFAVVPVCVGTFVIGCAAFVWFLRLVGLVWFWFLLVTLLVIGVGSVLRYVGSLRLRSVCMWFGYPRSCCIPVLGSFVPSV